ncbi:MAG: hypothetical protein CSA96_03175 [Bacteroidetes bacterium]|nr:MAG: hypothetical protein CSA96_03175 [Bacteroidota bacterium]
MDKCRIHIAILEPSDIVFEGLSASLRHSHEHFVIHRVVDLNDLENKGIHIPFRIVIMNPVLVLNRLSFLNKLRKKQADCSWVGLLYALYNQETVKVFDETIFLNEPQEIIEQKIKSIIGHCPCDDVHSDDLTEREKEVLTLLTGGCSNKDIAEKLNISVHTVISHRKNLVEKTGIKSLSGLTIYAITKKIISLNT